VVFVFVGKNNGIQAFYMLAQHLVSKVGAGVDHKNLFANLQHYR